MLKKETGRNHADPLRGTLNFQPNEFDIATHPRLRR